MGGIGAAGRPRRARAALAAVILVGGLWAADAAFAQETRGSILGTVKDASGGVLAGMVVVVTNEETNVSSEVVTNERGYYEVPYLVPGTYRVVVQADGFKKFTHSGLQLTVNNRLEVPVTLDVGALTDEVTVAAETPLLDTTSASASTSLSNRQVNSLPVFGNSAMLLTRSVPGVQWTGQPNYLGLHSNSGASGTNAAGGVGGTEYSLDGVSNSAEGRRVAYLPYTDTVAEIRVESANFDASKGHTSGASVSALTKSGTNAFRGSATWQYWNQEWNATQSTTNAAYYGAINDALAAGDTAEADRLRGQPKSPPGHSNNWATVIGGPVTLPKLFDGRDKLFFFFSYNGFKDVKTEEPTQVNRTVPTEAQRRGDFSELLRIDPVRYQIYDPRTARLENGRVVRDPFPNNQVPILNPVYQQYLRLMPLPNNPAGIMSPEGQFNYLAAATPYNWDYKAFSTRVDWNLSDRHRTFVRWSWNDFLEDRQDWTYESAPGLMSNGLVRQNLGATIDHVFVQNGTTIWNASVAFNRFTEGNTRNETQTSFSPAAVGFPAYMDERAREVGGGITHLPRIDFSDNSYSDFGLDRGGFTDYSVITARGELAKILATHSFKTGVDVRQHRRENIAGGNTSGVMTPRNDYVRQRDNTNNAGLLGLEWAAFMLGVTGITMDDNASHRVSNPYYAAYVQDDWRVSNRLTLNLGLRYEYEGGFREADNRAIGEFDFAAELPISAAAEQAYLRNPIAGLPSIEVRGGSVYAGLDGAREDITGGQHTIMPRAGAVWKLDEKTVLRGGYGWFYDTNNVLNAGIDQSGYSRGTGRTLTNNTGLSFLDADLRNGRTILHDPFPVREDGTRFNEPFGNALGISAKAGRGFDYEAYDWARAKQQRWRIGLQREIGHRMVAEVAYLGSYADDISIGDPYRRVDSLPGEFWSTGNVRNDANADYLNALVPNPFNIANFEFLRTQDPVLYQDMAANGFFTATTIRRHQLLRALPQQTSGNGLRNTRAPLGETKYHHLELSLQKRLSQGYEFTVGYTRAWHRDRDIFDNEFDERPVWRPSNDSRPHHLFVTAIVELPFGEGKPMFADRGLARALLGGWQVSGIYHLQSGRYIDWTANRFYYGENLEDIVLPRDERDRAHWFNTDQFERASARQPANFHVRMFPRRLDFAFGDYMNQLDMAVSRSVGLWGGSRFQVTLSAINVLNNVQWDQPNTEPTSGNFGVATQQWNTPRWLQLQGRLTF